MPHTGRQEGQLFLMEVPRSATGTMQFLPVNVRAERVSFLNRLDDLMRGFGGLA